MTKEDYKAAIIEMLDTADAEKCAICGTLSNRI